MATRGGIALRRDRADTHEGTGAKRPLTAGETAWLLLLPALVLSLALVVVLGPPLGRLAFTGLRYTFWPSERPVLIPKPTVLARFALTVICAVGYAAAIPLVARRTPRVAPERIRIAVLAVQALSVLALAGLWIAQRSVDRFGGGTNPSAFGWPTIAGAAALALLAAAALADGRATARLRAAGPHRRWAIACAALAALATVLWLLPSIFTDTNIVYGQPGVFFHLRTTYDEAMSVLDGRGPLVNMASYGALVPYLVALPLAWSHASVAFFTSAMVVLTALALLAVYGILRRLTPHPLAALALYLPFVAMSVFIVLGESVERFDFGDYFAMFPVRYAGPYVLAWLLARQLGGERPRSVVALSAFAGLVVLNNTDFGLPALGGLVLALLCARPPRTRAALGALAARAAAGLAIAYALVAALTLARAGTLPRFEWLLAYAHLFGLSGYQNLPTPALGFHLVILATYVAALALAAVRLAQRETDVTLTGMLAWCGTFGLGTGAYFVYRSHPDTLPAAYSIWALTLALLLIAALRAGLARDRLALSLPTLALLFAFGVAACSLAQFPLPWQQVQRIARTSPIRPLATPEAVAFVRANAPPHSTVAILTPTGHRIAWGSEVTDVTGYTGMTQMPTVDQLDQTLATLRAGHGDMVFLGDPYPPEAPAALQQAGFQMVASDPASRLMAFRRGG